MELVRNVEELEREAAVLEERCVSRERELRAPAVAAEAELRAVEQQVAELERRLAGFDDELARDDDRPVLTWRRGALGALALAAFTAGSAGSGIDFTRLSVGLFAAVWVAFLVGALRGR